MKKVGGRVGAILGASNGIVSFLGYGVYDGDFVPKEAVGMMADGLCQNSVVNPRITLDSGKVVYGCECWWGNEEDVKNRLKNYDKIVDVDIDQIREEWKKEQGASDKPETP